MTAVATVRGGRARHSRAVAEHLVADDGDRRHEREHDEADRHADPIAARPADSASNPTVAATRARWNGSRVRISTEYRAKNIAQ